MDTITMETLLTCAIQSLCSQDVRCVEHPQVAVVTGTEAGLTRQGHMVAHHTAAGGGKEGEMTFILISKQLSSVIG